MLGLNYECSAMPLLDIKSSFQQRHLSRKSSIKKL